MGTDQCNQPADDMDFVATRTLEAHHQDGTTGTIRVEIGRPERCTDEGDYRCTYRISGAGPSIRQRSIFGVDGLQALLLCIKAAGVELSIVQQKCRITWPGTDHEGSLLE